MTKKVLIIEDCRGDDVPSATGQVGTLDGNESVEWSSEETLQTPRIRLPDGSFIYGCECWWELYDPERELKDAQAEIEQEKAFFRAAVLAFEELSNIDLPRSQEMTKHFGGS